MTISTLITIPETLTLFIAPPAWGKTHMLIELYKNSKLKMVFLSPLRALANEFAVKMQSIANVFLIRSSSDLKENLEAFNKSSQGILVLTPELCSDSVFSVLDKNKNTIIICDEFHLFYYWGESFRWRLLETLMGAANHQLPILGLSATVSETLKKQVATDFATTDYEITLIDVGNQQLKYAPTKIWQYQTVRMVERAFLYELFRSKKTSETFLFFCQYRGQIDKWLEFCERNNIVALGCKGGEVNAFCEQLEKIQTPKCIFATTALSHGVNLPPISKIFFNSRIENLDFWIQMVGRGGRKGESYQLYCLNSFLKSQTWYLLLRDLYTRGWLSLRKFFLAF